MTERVACSGCGREGFHHRGVLARPDRVFCSDECEAGTEVRDALVPKGCPDCGVLLKPNEGLIDMHGRIPGRFCSSTCLNRTTMDFKGRR